MYVNQDFCDFSYLTWLQTAYVADVFLIISINVRMYCVRNVCSLHVYCYIGCVSKNGPLLCLKKRTPTNPGKNTNKLQFNLHVLLLRLAYSFRQVRRDKNWGTVHIY